MDGIGPVVIGGGRLVILASVEGDIGVAEYHVGEEEGSFDCGQKAVEFVGVILCRADKAHDEHRQGDAEENDVVDDREFGEDFKDEGQDR